MTSYKSAQIEKQWKSIKRSIEGIIEWMKLREKGEGKIDKSDIESVINYAMRNLNATCHTDKSS